MIEFFKYILSDLGPFIGFAIILYIVLQFIFKSYNRFLRYKNIKNQGWPPPHCDADGDFKKEEKDEDI